MGVGVGVISPGVSVASGVGVGVGRHLPLLADFALRGAQGRFHQRVGQVGNLAGHGP